ncbi:hypothetical protein, partial [Pseudomonas viridiflava]|uniref:hypothetical protein n=1 Tax=Pseudomonas viridiflava TaxID=33069 RepID=UPI00197C7494
IWNIAFRHNPEKHRAEMAVAIHPVSVRASVTYSTNKDRHRIGLTKTYNSLSFHGMTISE